MSKINIGIAGLGNVGSALVKTIQENKNYFFDKTDVELNIVGISARTKNKKGKKESCKVFNHTKDSVSSIFSNILKHCTA